MMRSLCDIATEKFGFLFFFSQTKQSKCAILEYLVNLAPRMSGEHIDILYAATPSDCRQALGKVALFTNGEF